MNKIIIKNKIFFIFLFFYYPFILYFKINLNNFFLKKNKKKDPSWDKVFLIFYFLNLILNFFFINSKQFLELIDSGLLIYLFIYLFFVKLPRQTKNVFVYYLVSSKTVEEFVWNKCCAKNWVKNKIKFKKLKINLKKSYHLKQLIKKIHKEFSKKKILKLITLDQEIMKKIKIGILIL
jgi:hypothetical protein